MEDRVILGQVQMAARHDPVLRKLAEVVEKRRQKENNGSQPETQQWTQFLREGEAGNCPQKTNTHPSVAR